MPKKMVSVKLSDEMLSDIDIAKITSGDKNRTAFLERAIQLYIASLEMRGIDSSLISDDAVALIKDAAADPLKEIEKQQAELKALLFAIWRRINHASYPFSKEEFENLLTGAVSDSAEDADYQQLYRSAYDEMVSRRIADEKRKKK